MNDDSLINEINILEKQILLLEVRVKNLEKAKK